jgi:hypothetical protein
MDFEDTDTEIDYSLVDCSEDEDGYIVDPMCFDDGTVIGTIDEESNYPGRRPIASGTLYVVGDPCVEFNGVTYTSANDMPPELRKLFWDGKARADERVKIIKENQYWFAGEKDFYTYEGTEFDFPVSNDECVGENAYDTLSDLLCYAYRGRGVN